MILPSMQISEEILMFLKTHLFWKHSLLQSPHGNQQSQSRVFFILEICPAPELPDETPVTT